MPNLIKCSLIFFVGVIFYSSAFSQQSDKQQQAKQTGDQYENLPVTEPKQFIEQVTKADKKNEDELAAQAEAIIPKKKQKAEASGGLQQTAPAAGSSTSVINAPASAPSGTGSSGTLNIYGR